LNAVGACCRDFKFQETAIAKLIESTEIIERAKFDRRSIYRKRQINGQSIRNTAIIRLTDSK